MKLHYATLKLERTLTDMRLLKKYYGSDCIKISSRLSELRAANNLSEIPVVPPPRRHKLSGNFADCWGINYSKNDRIVIRPVGECEILDLKSIVEILIVDLGDYH